jgi:adhesin/invasin
LAAVAGLLVTGAACQKMPLVAPSGTALQLVAATNVLPVNGEADITAVLIEGGLEGGASQDPATPSSGNGTPVHNGTLVTFTTTLGRLEPGESRTEAGRATTKLIADGRSGVATITAFSGAATNTIDVNIGAAGAAHVSVTANPQSLPGTGGTTTISARVEDQQGNGLLGVPVSFSTTKGTLSKTSVISSDQGIASTSLTTTQEATVTASTGGSTEALSGTVVVSLKPRTTVAISAPASATVGVPASFTITPATGAVITNVHVDFGDGLATDLGEITSATTVGHPFRSPGVLTVRATATDSEGGTGTASTQVVVTPLVVTLTFAPNSTSAPGVADIVTFTATPSLGALIEHYDWVFGDGSVGNSVSNQATHSYLAKGAYTVSVTAVPAGNGAPAANIVTVDVK